MKCDVAEMAESLIELKKYLLKHAILVRELKPENMVCSRGDAGNCTFILIDGWATISSFRWPAM